MSRWLFLPSSVLSDLEILANLDASQIGQLIRIFESDTGKPHYSASLQIAEAISVPDEDAANVYSLWRYVQQERIRNGKTGDDVVEELLAFLTARLRAADPSSPFASPTPETVDRFRANREALAAFFGEHPARDKARKVDRLGRGPIPHFVECKVLCDVRPIYDDAAESIEQEVMVLTLALVTHGNHDEYKDVIVNLTEGDLGAIEEEMARVRKKIAVLRGKVPGLVSRTPSHKREGDGNGS